MRKRMQFIVRRGLGILLSLSMILGSVSLPASASESETARAEQMQAVTRALAEAEQEEPAASENASAGTEEAKGISAGTDAAKGISAGTETVKVTSAGADAAKVTSAGTDAAKETSAGTAAKTSEAQTGSQTLPQETLPEANQEKEEAQTADFFSGEQEDSAGTGAEAAQSGAEAQTDGHPQAAQSAGADSGEQGGSAETGAAAQSGSTGTGMEAQSSSAEAGTAAQSGVTEVGTEVQGGSGAEAGTEAQGGVTGADTEAQSGSTEADAAVQSGSAGTGAETQGSGAEAGAAAQSGVTETDTEAQSGSTEADAAAQSGSTGTGTEAQSGSGAEAGTEAQSGGAEADTRTQESGTETDTGAQGEPAAASLDDDSAQALISLASESGSGSYTGSSREEGIKFQPGSYTVTANLYVPGELNTVLTGVTAYLTNPNNPLGLSEGDAVERAIPNTPVYSNATLVIGDDGTTKTLTVPVKNPVFTLQQISSGSNVTVLDTVRNSTTYQNTAGTAVRSGRITSVTVQLLDNSGLYTFTDCVEFPTLLGTDWTVPLSLGVDLSGIPEMETEPETESGTETGQEDGDAYQMLEGSGSTWKKGSGYTLLFRSNADFSVFAGVTVDGNAVAEDYYNAFTGSTYIELKSAYLEMLDAGSHVIRIVSEDGFASGSFTVEAAESEPESDGTEPETGGEETESESESEEPESETESGKETESGRLAAGTYRITANLYVPGELNTQLPGVNAYMTNPNNPLGIVPDGMESVEATAPTTPVSDNAVLTVDEKGEMTLVLDVVNPVFTLQQIGSSDTVTVLYAVRDSNTYSGNTGVSRQGRITRIYVKLTDDSGEYKFEDCVEFPTLLETDWDVPMYLKVEFSDAEKISDETTVEIPGSQDPGGTETESETKAETEPETKTETESETKTETESETTAAKTNTDPSAGSGTLKAGTYTVAANIWIDKSSSGLPLNPHLTSSVFPPKDPVSNNAALTIDANGNASVLVPIVIPSKVMSVKSISGLDIISSTSEGGYLTSITVNLGRVTNPDAVITKSCTVSLDLGELAQQISGKEKEQTWGATFQVNFSGIPSGESGGGNVDVSALIASAQSQSETTAEAEEEEETEIVVGVLPGMSSLSVAEMMHEAQTETKETGTDAWKYTYHFIVEETESGGGAETVSGDGAETESGSGAETASGSAAEAESGAETDEEKLHRTLAQQMLQAFRDGKRDIILCTADDAAELLTADDAADTLRILSVAKYWVKADAKADHVLVLAIASADFVREHEEAAKEFLTLQTQSIAAAEASPEQTAAYALALGLYGQAADAARALNTWHIGLYFGADMQSVTEEEIPEENYPAEEVYYVPETETAQSADAAAESGTETAQSAGTAAENGAEMAQSTDAAEAESGGTETAQSADTAAESGAEMAQSTDAAATESGAAAGGTELSEEEALKNAIEQALAERESETPETANSQGLDIAAQQTAAETLDPGTYTVSANLYLPGELNTQLPGVTAYMTNPDNPLGVGGHEGVPMTPVTDNATLVVAEDGTKTVIVDVVNPVFTLQGIGSPRNAKLLAAVWDSERYEGTNGVGVDGRITRLYIELGDGTGVYPFDDCHEFPTLLETDWYVVLELSVEFTSAQKVSEETTYEIPEGAVTELK